MQPLFFGRAKQFVLLVTVWLLSVYTRQICNSLIFNKLRALHIVKQCMSSTYYCAVLWTCCFVVANLKINNLIAFFAGLF